MTDRVYPYGNSPARQRIHDITSLARQTIYRAESSCPDGVVPQNLSAHILKRRTKTNHPFIDYALHTYRNLFLTFIFNMSMPFTAPFNALMLITVYPTLVLGLLVIELLFWLILDKFGGKVLIARWSEDFGEGLTPVNWGDPTIFSSSEAKRLMTMTLPSLNTPLSTVPSHPPNQTRIFDLSIAQTFLLLSSLIYERDDDKVKVAFNMYMADETRKIIDQETAELRMKSIIDKAEHRIREQARAWGLTFEGVSELKSLGGPFCGIFSSTRSNCIIVTFKGTTPNNCDEFLIDATIQRVDARPFLFGAVHEGFYGSIFPTSGEDTRNPFGAILFAIHSTAASIQKYRNLQPAQPVNVWITGHSLGAALASTLFARFLKSPHDLDPKLCVLRSGYLFGTPAIGDSDFAAHFASCSNAPYEAQTTLWRVINGSDIICRLPPGVDDPSISMHLGRQAFFNFAHVGLGIKLEATPGKPCRPIVVPSAYQPTVDVRIVCGAYDNDEEGEFDNVSAAIDDDNLYDDSNDEVDLDAADLAGLPNGIGPAWWLKAVAGRMGANPIRTLESLYPAVFHNHLPYRYLDSLRRAREFVIQDKL